MTSTCRLSWNFGVALDGLVIDRYRRRPRGRRPVRGHRRALTVQILSGH